METSHSKLFYSRRQVLHLGAAGMLLAGLTPESWADADSGEDFSFICVNDLHYFDNKCDDFFQRMVRQMNAHGADGKTARPQLCLIVGDLAEDGLPAQFSAIRDHLKKLTMPWNVVVGNHDYLGMDNRTPFDSFFPKQINYTFDHAGWQFVALDTTQGRRGSGTSVAKETLTWLSDNVPKLDAKKPTILFTHFPLGFFVPGRPKNADDVLTPFKDVNLRAVFNGHFHGYTERSRWNAGITTDKCCSFHHANHDGTKEKGYFLCTAGAGKIERTFLEVKMS